LTQRNRGGGSISKNFNSLMVVLESYLSLRELPATKNVFEGIFIKVFKEVI